MNNVWIGAVSALCGVLITAAFGLLATQMAQRWQFRDKERERKLSLHAERREVYARYLVSAQHVFTATVELFAASQHKLGDKARFNVQPPVELRNVIEHNQGCRVEVLLLAGERVRRAVSVYDERLRIFWQEKAVGIGTSAEDDDEEATYHALIDAMRDEVIAV